jgi:type I restriction enzyme M protein
LEAEQAAEILGCVQGFADVPDRARVVSLKDIREEDWTLNISRYVLPPAGEAIPPLDVALADFKAALERARQAEERLRDVLRANGL